MNDEYNWRTGRSCIFKNIVHLVFVTKYRRDVFTDVMLHSLNELLSETCIQMDCELLEFNGEENHVHLLVSVHPKQAISNLVSKLKGKSSYVLRKLYWDQIKNKLWGSRFWSPSYCVVSCGGGSLKVVKEYIMSQKKPSDAKGVAQSKRYKGRKRDSQKKWLT